MQGQMVVSGTGREDINRLCATVTECSAAGWCVCGARGPEACRTKVTSRSEPELGRWGWVGAKATQKGIPLCSEKR